MIVIVYQLNYYQSIAGSWKQTALVIYELGILFKCNVPDGLKLFFHLFSFS